MKRKFGELVKCGFCGRMLSPSEILSYGPEPKNPLEEELFPPDEQCPYCGYHSTSVDDQYYDIFDLI